jgi:hypothetical protein
MKLSLCFERAYVQYCCSANIRFLSFPWILNAVITNGFDLDDY